MLEKWYEDIDMFRNENDCIAQDNATKRIIALASQFI